MISRLRQFLEWLGDRSGIVLAAMLVVVAGTYLFIKLADEVIEGDTQHFDNWAVRSLRSSNDPLTPVGPRWVGEVARDLTALGGVAVLTLMTLFVAGYLLMVRKYHAMWLVIIATGSGLIVSSILK